MRSMPVLVMSLVVSAAWAAACPAQTMAEPLAPAPEVTAPPPADAQDARSPLSIEKGALGPDYLDASFGFSVRPLAGARVDRRKRTVEGLVQIAQFVRLEVGWSMALRYTDSRRPIDAVAVRHMMLAGLMPEYPDVEITQAESKRVDGRQAIRAEASFSTEGQLWLRQQLVVPLRAKQYIVVTLTTPADDREVAGTAFDQIVASFKVVRTQAQQEALEAALQRGVTLRRNLVETKRKISTTAADKPTYLRITRDGESVGFVETLEAAVNLDGAPGLRIQQTAWVFNLDGSVQFAREDKFVADNMDLDKWQTISQVMPSPAVDPDRRVVATFEAGIRRGDQLIVDYNEKVGVSEKQEKLVGVEPSYAPAAWPLLLPRLIDLNEPELYAFSMYDSDRRGMILRTFRVVGPTQVTIGGGRVSAIKIEDSEGLLPPVGEIDVDSDGRVVRLVSGPLEMVSISQAEAEREFAPRVKAIQDKLKVNVPPEIPSSGRKQPAPAPQRPSR